MNQSINLERKAIAHYLLIILLIIQGVGAVAGGAALVIRPSGEVMGMSTSVLINGPFNNFLIPGLILLLVLGVWPLVVAYGLITGRECSFSESLNIFKSKFWAWTHSLYIGFAIIIWIQVEIMVTGYNHWLQSFYTFMGLAILVLALWPSVQNHYPHEKIS